MISLSLSLARDPPRRVLLLPHQSSGPSALLRHKDDDAGHAGGDPAGGGGARVAAVYRQSRFDVFLSVSFIIPFFLYMFFYSMSCVLLDPRFENFVCG